MHFPGQYSSASDMYAFAVMLNELMLQEVPFDGLSLSDIVYEVTVQKARPRRFTAPAADMVGSRLVHYIGVCWNQDRDLRMSFKTLEEALSQLLAAAVEIVRTGKSASASASQHPQASAPDMHNTPDAAVTALSEWFTSSCQIMPRDSTSLAHSLVTVKCITSVDALRDVLLECPDLLTQELNQPTAYNSQIKHALSKYKKMLLDDLTMEQVCVLMDHHRMSSIKRIVIEEEISGEMSLVVVLCLFVFVFIFIFLNLFVYFRHHFGSQFCFS
jgi:serine/threonine protein kinase